MVVFDVISLIWFKMWCPWGTPHVLVCSHFQVLQVICHIKIFMSYALLGMFNGLMGLIQSDQNDSASRFTERMKPWPFLLWSNAVIKLPWIVSTDDIPVEMGRAKLYGYTQQPALSAHYDQQSTYTTFALYQCGFSSAREDNIPVPVNPKINDQMSKCFVRTHKYGMTWCPSLNGRLTYLFLFGANLMSSSVGVYFGTWNCRSLCCGSTSHLKIMC